MNLATLLSLVVAQATPTPQHAAEIAQLRTVAEASDYSATARYAEVVSFCSRLAELSPRVHLDELGRTSEGRALPLLFIGKRPRESVAERRAGGRLLLLAIGNIHAGEVCGKEALLALARELALAPSLPAHVDVALVPIYNADGNERVSPANRPGQLGPEKGMGIRANAQGLDLNRDYVKLAAPETRALASFLAAHDPEVIIDTHTTNGSFHRYILTYAGPANPVGSERVRRFVGDRMMPAVNADFAATHGGRTFPYGNFDRERTRWSTYPDLPRYGTRYRGIRNRVAILSEAYAYAPYRDRVLATRAFVEACLKYAEEHHRAILDLVAAADRETIAAGERGAPIALRSRPASSPPRVRVLGFVEEVRDGRRVATDTPREYEVELATEFEPALEISRPFAYAIPERLEAVVVNLAHHGVSVEVLRQPIETEVEVYRISSIERAAREFEGHRLVTVEASAASRSETLPAGSLVVRTAQPLGALAAYLLEPQAADGLVAWNFFDADLAEGGEFPVLRLSRPRELPLAPLPRRRENEQRIERTPAAERPGF